jgi:hypothetical protein
MEDQCKGVLAGVSVAKTTHRKKREKLSLYQQEGTECHWGYHLNAPVCACGCILNNLPTDPCFLTIVQQVDEALATMRTVLEVNKKPVIAADVPHAYDDKVRVGGLRFFVHKTQCCFSVFVG